MSWWVVHLLALLLGFCLDLLLGDPPGAPHPVRVIGALIAALEKGLRRIFPKSPGGELAGGIVQGLGGSPILQKGRLRAAGTHVLVHDAARGNGILAENMFRQATGCQAQAS